MPLKHFTETALVILLGIMLLLAGVAIDTLPLLPEGALPWAIAFAVSIFYALALYPMLRRNRAEYSFRLLHFLPAVMLVLWLVIQLLALREPRALIAHHWYTWGFGILAVTAGMLLLIAFCLNVIRRRVPRVATLLVLLLPFTAFAFVSERSLHMDERLSHIVWQGDWWNVVGSGAFLALVPPEESVNGQNLDPSNNPQEESWRSRLRALEERRRQIAAERSAQSSLSRSVESSSRSSMTSSRASSKHVVATNGKTPPKLPSSGFDPSVFIVFGLAGYTAILHERARKRKCYHSHHDHNYFPPRASDS